MAQEHETAILRAAAQSIYQPDDFVVLPAALSAAQAATLHSSGRLPI